MGYNGTQGKKWGVSELKKKMGYKYHMISLFNSLETMGNSRNKWGISKIWYL